MWQAQINNPMFQLCSISCLHNFPRASSANTDFRILPSFHSQSYITCWPAASWWQKSFWLLFFYIWLMGDTPAISLFPVFVITMISCWLFIISQTEADDSNVCVKTSSCCDCSTASPLNSLLLSFIAEISTNSTETSPRKNPSCLLLGSEPSWQEQQWFACLDNWPLWIPHKENKGTAFSQIKVLWPEQRNERNKVTSFPKLQWKALFSNEMSHVSNNRMVMCFWVETGCTVTHHTAHQNLSVWAYNCWIYSSSV